MDIMILRIIFTPFTQNCVYNKKPDINIYVMFNKRVGVFYHNIKHDA
jgi:hypothetical protein